MDIKEKVQTLLEKLNVLTGRTSSLEKRVAKIEHEQEERKKFFKS